MTSEYIFGVLFFLLIILLTHVFLLRPMLEGRMLRNWYRKQQSNWLATENRVTGPLANFVRSRYVRWDRSGDGTVRPLDCTTYLHPFLFTSNGRPTIVALASSATPSAADLTVVSTHNLPNHQTVRSLMLREYVTECLENPITDWPRLFRDPNHDDEQQQQLPNTVLQRYTYRVSFEDEAPAASDNTYPVTAADALVAQQRQRQQLVFEFTDTVDRRTWRFALPQYQRSALGRVRSAENPQSDAAPDVWQRLPQLWLDRSASRSVRDYASSAQSDRRSQDLVLFNRGGDTDNDVSAPQDLNPCWNANLARFVTGNFPVTAQQYSTIYLRGLQQVSRNDEATTALLGRMYWRCVWDYDSGGLPSSVSSASEGQGPVRGGDDKNGEDRSFINNNSILYGTLLSLNLCGNELCFDQIAGKCV